jgi:hypothetical protein
VPQSSRSAGALLVVGVALLGACSDSPSGSSWVDAARVDPGGQTAGGFDDELPSTIGCEPLGVDEPAVAAAPTGAPPTGDLLRGTGNDPYTATGARQLPGPDMVRVAPHPSPVSVVVARPVDPDEHVAARQADAEDTGPVPPSRYEPGRGSPAFTGGDGPARSTTTEAASDDPDEQATDAPSPADPGPCLPVLGP